jgi:gamma-glutamyltranspeptidase/glutathione hydrolase
MDVQEAGDAPRFHHEGSSEPTGSVMKDGGTLNLESGVPANVVRDLALKGHRIAENPGVYGGYQGIWIDWSRGVLIAGTESRKDGCALGY